MPTDDKPRRHKNYTREGALIFTLNHALDLLERLARAGGITNLGLSEEVLEFLAANGRDAEGGE